MKETAIKTIGLECNIDDMTAEELAFAAERILAGGAIDVYTTPIVMKKGRPAQLLTVMTTEAGREKMLELIFKYTTTLGIREKLFERYILERREVVLDTSFGPVRCKLAEGYGVKRAKLEYEDLARIAVEQELSIADVRRQIQAEQELK